MNDWPALKENRPMTDPIPLLTALQEIAPDILSAASSREVAARNATGEPGPLGKLSADLAAEAMADQGERTDTLRRIVAAWRPRERPAPSATFTPDVLRALESAQSADPADPAEATATLDALADALDPPKLHPLSAYADAPVPAAVLWRDTGDHDPDGYQDAVLSIGEVALLSAAGGIGKSMTVLAVAAAAAGAHVKAQSVGNACGLRVMAGPVALVSYEDSPARLADRLRAMVPDPAERKPAMIHLHVAPEPAALWTEDGPGADWAPLWRTIRRTGARLLVIDPASAALADVSTTDTGPVRSFLRELTEAAQPAGDWLGCGVLIVAHSTKAGRNAMAAGEAPDAGVVAGSAAWYDGARGVLSMTELAEDARILECVKSNYGRSGWGARLRARHNADGRLLGFELADRMERSAIEEAREARRGEGRTGTAKRNGAGAGATGAVPANGNPY